jgi:hypothetical protein
MSSLSRGAFAAVTAFAVIAAGAAPAVAAAPGHVTALAPVSSPGYPALPHVVGDRVYEGTYDNPKGDSVPSRVFEYSLSGALVQTFTVAGQDLSHPHGIQVAANDALGRLMLLDKTSGRIIRLDPRTGVQSLYSRVPDLPVCSASSAGTPCSPALVDQAPMPDYAAWGPDGELYVTDYQQAVIWRIPPGGGEARIWLADRRLDGGPFGTACITMMPDGHTLLFDQASNGGLGTLTPSTGKLYTVAIAPNGDPGPLRQLWERPRGRARRLCAGHVRTYLRRPGGLLEPGRRAKFHRPGAGSVWTAVHGGQRLAGPVRLSIRRRLPGQPAADCQSVLLRRRPGQPGGARPGDRGTRPAGVRPCPGRAAPCRGQPPAPA